MPGVVLSGELSRAAHGGDRWSRVPRFAYFTRATGRARQRAAVWGGLPAAAPGALGHVMPEVPVAAVTPCSYLRALCVH